MGEKPQIDWIEEQFQALKSVWPDEDEGKLREFAAELIARAEQMAEEMKAKRLAREAEDATV